MNNPHSESDFPTPDELDELCQVIDVVVEGSNTLIPPVKIIDPKRLAHLQAERDKLEQYKAMGYEFTGECLDVVIDGPSEPIDPKKSLDPKTLARLKAERDKIVYWTKVYRHRRAQSQEPNSSQTEEANHS